MMIRSLARLTLVTAIGVGTASMAAAADSAAGIRILLGGGMDISRYSVPFTSPGGENHFRLGPQFGVDVLIPVSKTIAYQTGVEYHTKGIYSEGWYRFFGPEARYELRDRLNYLNVPVAMRLGFPGLPLCPALCAGADLGIFLAGASHTEYLTPNGNEIGDDSLDLRFKHADLAVRLGADTIVARRPAPIHVRVFYSHGLTDISPPTDRYESRNRCLTVSLAVEVL